MCITLTLYGDCLHLICPCLTRHMWSAHCICLSTAWLCLSPALSLTTGKEDEMIKTVNEESYIHVYIIFFVSSFFPLQCTTPLPLVRSVIKTERERETDEEKKILSIFQSLTPSSTSSSQMRPVVEVGVWSSGKWGSGESLVITGG